jgi:hypothetical protein
MSRPQHHGTRTPVGLPPSGGPQNSVRYAVQAAWPGIEWGFDARYSCTWVMKDGVYQVKFRDAMCVNHMTGAVRG